MERKFIIAITAAVLVILFVFVIGGCSRVESEEEVKVTAKVVEKNYRGAYTTYIPIKVGKVTTMSPQHHPERYEITVEYEDITETFDSEEWYNLVEEGEEIEVILYLGYDKDGELLKKDLFLIE